MVASKSPILSCHPGSLNSFALKLRSSDTLTSLRERCSRKLALPPSELCELSLKYLWFEVYYSLQDEDDFSIFQQRHANSDEVTVLLSSPSIPTENPSIASISSIPPSSAATSSFSSSPHHHHHQHGLPGAPGRGRSGTEEGSVYSNSNQSFLYGRGIDPQSTRSQTSMHLVTSSEFSNGGGGGSVKSGRTGKSQGTTIGKGSIATTTRTKRTKSLAPTVPEHKIKFEEFHNQLGVRTFIGSIGPVENVRMMMKSGHRACYMSRAFAQQHNFIPADAAPGFYGFSGITNLGVWPIKVGSKTVEQQVMLVENSYFPVILGRSFMERRGVRTDPLDQTSVVFMDTNEAIPTDLVIVKDKQGRVVPIS
ncbi:uncharacterized protein JCM6883_001792 [Sporobolomyces salmoneus]|uniref:uncharacterized protein n=1 Tax=Sporobolomyces salmoneus TaxID=183962 RepID=UPI00317C4DD2